jgi:hypothetical protein
MSFLKTNYPTVLGTYSNISQDELLTLTNQKRKEIGLPPLILNGVLSQAAAGKAADMFGKDYWAHVAPDGTTPWVFIKNAGYNYIYAGENLARGYSSPPEVVNAWMASPTHKENMLSAKYNDVGFAIETGKLSGEDTVLVVEMLGSTSFAANKVNTTAQSPQKAIEVAVISPVPTSAPSENSQTLAVKINPNKQLAQININLTQKPLVNGATFSVLSARVVVSLFIFVLILDMVIIERKKILRFVGHNLDHVIFLSVLLLIIFVLAKGAIL